MYSMKEILQHNYVKRRIIEVAYVYIYWTKRVINNAK